MITSRQKPATLGELKEIELVQPEGVSERWKGVQHGELVETIHAELDSRDITVAKENWYVSGKHDGRLHGSMNLTIPGITSFEGSQFSLGVGHSNLADQSIKFAVGAHIFICSNGMVTGDYAIKRRHTKGVNVPEMISDGITTYLEKIVDVADVQKQMAERELPVSEVDRMLMEAGRAQLLSWGHIGQVDREYQNPTFADHSEKTAWGLYNAFTYIAQKQAAPRQIRAMNNFREIVLN